MQEHCQRSSGCLLTPLRQAQKKKLASQDAKTVSLGGNEVGCLWTPKRQEKQVQLASSDAKTVTTCLCLCPWVPPFFGPPAACPFFALAAVVLAPCPFGVLDFPFVPLLPFLRAPSTSSLVYLVCLNLHLACGKLSVTSLSASFPGRG